MKEKQEATAAAAAVEREVRDKVDDYKRVQENPRLRMEELQEERNRKFKVSFPLHLSISAPRRCLTSSAFHCFHAVKSFKAVKGKRCVE